MKKRLLLGMWEPDSNAILGNGRVDVAVNVVPVKGGYKAIRGESLSERYFGTVPTTDIIGSNVVGAFSAVNGDDAGGIATLNPYVDYIATTTDVYEYGFFAIATSPVVTGTGMTSSVKDFAQYGGQVYCATGINTSGTAPVFYIEVSGGMVFSQVPTGFQAQSVGVLRDFVVYGGTYDATDGVRRTRVRWSAFGNGQLYTPSAATQADYQDLPDWVGPIQKVLGGEDAFIICENAVVLMTYTGGATIMRFDILTNVGSSYGFSCVRVDDYAYMWSSRGFARIGKARGDVAYIGLGRVDEEYQQNLYTALIAKPSFQARAYHDEENKVIGWQFDASSGRAICYCYASDQWVTHGTTTDRAGVAVVYASRLSRISGGYSAGVMGNLSTAAWIGSDKRHYSLTHRTQKAKVQLATGYEELTPGRKSIVSKVWPVVDVRGGSLTNPEVVVTAIPKVMSTAVYSEPTSTYSSTASLQSEGFFSVTGKGGYAGKYHRIMIENSDTASERTGEQAFLGFDVEYFQRGVY